MVVTVGYLPIVLPLLFPGVTVDPWPIARFLVLLMLLPLAAGLALNAFYEGLAARVKPILDWISNVSLILLVLLITAANIDKILQVFGTFGFLPDCFLPYLGLELVGCLADVTLRLNVSWRLAPASATLLPHLWSRAKALTTQGWSFW